MFEKINHINRMNIKNGIAMKCVNIRNLKKYINPPQRKDKSSEQVVTQNSDQKKAEIKPLPPKSKVPPLAFSSNYFLKDKYADQPTDERKEDDYEQTQLDTLESNFSKTKYVPTSRNSRSPKFLIPLSKLTTSSIENASKIIPSITTRRFKPPVSTNTSPFTKSTHCINTNLSILNQLVKNQEQHSKNAINQTVSRFNSDISFSNSTITSSSNIPKSVTNKGHHKRESSISMSSANDIMIISHEDLLLIEDKLHDIMSVIELGYTAEKECFEWWNYYFNSTLAGKYEEYYLNEINKNKINSYVNIELLCVMLCYEISFNQEAFNEYVKEFKAIFSFLHFNLLLMIKLIITMQKGYDLSFTKLNNMIKKSLTVIKEKEIDEFFISSLITHNMNSVSDIYLKIIEKEYHNSMQSSLKHFFDYAYQNRKTITVEEYNDFFRLNVVRVNNPEGSILASSITMLSESLKAKPKPKVPFLSIGSKFKYTLILDLDETLVHLKENQNNGCQHVLKFRPDLIKFLRKVKKKFELVVFTAGTQDYADPIIDLIENNDEFFSHRLYREHTLVVGNDFIKDLTKLGRDLSQVVIVDNMPQNYRLQKGNGIFIKAFLGDNYYDTALNHLGEILYKIAYENGDIRKGLLKYKDEIITKVSLNKTS